jgi:uncharacterized membrane protein YjjB (DUF3815 family)
MISWTSAFRSAQLVVGIVILIGFFAVLAIMIKTDAAGKDILIGALAAAFGSVVGYWYGSSNSSERKTELLAKSNDPLRPS